MRIIKYEISDGTSGIITEAFIIGYLIELINRQCMGIIHNSPTDLKLDSIDINSEWRNQTYEFHLITDPKDKVKELVAISKYLLDLLLELDINDQK